MCIPSGCDIGLEIHKDTDQIIRVESGRGIACMGDNKECLTQQCPVCDGYMVFVPAGTWHNIINTGNCPLKLSSVYSPPHHPKGTVEKTKMQAMANENKGAAPHATAPPVMTPQATVMPAPVVTAPMPAKMTPPQATAMPAKMTTPQATAMPPEK
jgi:mannose-6-phosphate isomerase-like protein (cupin superfamily)